MPLLLRPLTIPRWLPLLPLALLAIAANQMGVELFYGYRLHLGSSLMVLALLLYGNRGLPVGLAAVLLVPRLWAQPLALLPPLVEVLWLQFYLDHVGDPPSRRDNGWIVLADILYWMLIGIPLTFILFGGVLNQDPSTVLTLAIGQGVNGSLNATLAFLIYAGIRLQQARRSRERSVGIHGLALVAMLSAILLPSLLILSVTVQALNVQTCQAQLLRLRQAALSSASLTQGAMAELNRGKPPSMSLLEFRVLAGGGTTFYDSNPGLFRTLESGYSTPDQEVGICSALRSQLELLVPLEAQDTPRGILRSYWRYSTTSAGVDESLLPLPQNRDQEVVVVEPARTRIRELENQSNRALGTLAWIVVIGAVVAETVAQSLERQFPTPPPPREEQPGERLPSGNGIRQRQQHSLLRELQPLVESLQRSEADRLALRQDLQRSELQRRRLQGEVDSLSILDPLTGCYNRRELYRRIDHELRRGERQEQDLSFLCLAIDHLREIQESYGRPMAEEALRAVASELRSRSRTTDGLYRFGEDQFALLLPACDDSSARRLGEVLCRALSQLEILHESCRLSVTLSVGVTGLRRGRDDAESLITRAENALYRAKVEGRDRVVVI